jgi:EAL and modified HD-GYP domain-containing signal transduction protein
MSQASVASVEDVAAVHIGRQPIYEGDGTLHAYELLFRRSSGDVSSHRDGSHVVSQSEDDDATTSTILAAFSAFDLRELLSGRPGFVNLTRAFLVGSLPIPFLPDAAVLEVLETVEVDDEVVAGVHRLSDAGYEVALDDFVYRPGTEPLLDVASIVKVDVLGTPWEEVLLTARHGLAHGARLLAERVEDEAMLRRCMAEGFDLFQGYHLGRPETLTAQTLTPAHALLLHILAQLGNPDVSAKDLEASLQRDAALTFRLLTIANSAAGGSRRFIRSLRDAVVLVGLAKLRSWVVLLVLSGSRKQQPGLASALVQAYSCEGLARTVPELAWDEAFTLGLLDGLGNVLGVQPQDMPSLMPALAPDLTAALCGAPNDLRRVLDAVHAYQRHDSAALSVSPWSLQDVSQAYLAGLANAARAEADLGM